MHAGHQHRNAVAITGANPLAPRAIARKRAIKRWKMPCSS
jgi:hypothetical protein